MAKYVNKACCLTDFPFFEGIQLFSKISKSISFGYTRMVALIAGNRVDKRKSANSYSTRHYKNFLQKKAKLYLMVVYLSSCRKMMVKLVYNAKSGRCLLKLECSHFYGENISYLSGYSV